MYVVTHWHIHFLSKFLFVLASHTLQYRNSSVLKHFSFLFFSMFFQYIHYLDLVTTFYSPLLPSYHPTSVLTLSISILFTPTLFTFLLLRPISLLSPFRSHLSVYFFLLIPLSIPCHSTYFIIFHLSLIFLLNSFSFVSPLLIYLFSSIFIFRIYLQHCPPSNSAYRVFFSTVSIRIPFSCHLTLFQSMSLFFYLYSPYVELLPLVPSSTILFLLTNRSSPLPLPRLYHSRTSIFNESLSKNSSQDWNGSWLYY